MAVTWKRMQRDGQTYLQLGESATATQNFTLSVPSPPDGTMALKRGNVGVESATIFSVDASGNFALTNLLDLSGAAAGQIKFPATQNSSADANTLDDYEENTWTPNQGAGLVVVGAFSSSGNYTKVGRLVMYNGTLIGATSIAATGGAALTSNLPFTVGVRPSIGVFTNDTLVYNANTYASLSTTTLYACTNTVASGALHFSGMYFT